MCCLEQGRKREDNLDMRRDRRAPVRFVLTRGSKVRVEPGTVWPPPNGAVLLTARLPLPQTTVTVHDAARLWGGAMMRQELLRHEEPVEFNRRDVYGSVPQDRLQGASVYFWMIRNGQRLLHSTFETTEFDVATLPADDLKPESLKHGDDFLPRKPLELRHAEVRVGVSSVEVQS